MTREHSYFNYYCLDRLKPLGHELTIAYNDDGYIRKVSYHFGLRAKVKNRECYIFYTEDNYEDFIYAPVDYIDEHYESLMLNVQNKEELFSYIKSINTMNIFEFTSLLLFSYIYSDFKDLIDYNWDVLKMNDLIEL